eukprot:1153210-Pelagomonas_calceolata.AAC.1
MHARARYNNLKYSSRSKDWSTKLDSVPDIEDLVSVGRGHTLCPFYMSKDAAKVRCRFYIPVELDYIVPVAAGAWHQGPGQCGARPHSVPLLHVQGRGKVWTLVNLVYGHVLCPSACSRELQRYHGGVPATSKEAVVLPAFEKKNTFFRVIWATWEALKWQQQGLHKGRKPMGRKKSGRENE